MLLDRLTNIFIFSNLIYDGKLNVFERYNLITYKIYWDQISTTFLPNEKWRLLFSQYFLRTNHWLKLKLKDIYFGFRAQTYNIVVAM